MGAGQLAQMTCLAGQEMGYEMHVYASRADEPAALVADRVWLGELRDAAHVREFAQAVSAFAYDTEHLPIASVRLAAEYACACPSPDLLQATQNRIRERELLQSLRVPIPQVAFIRSEAEAVAVAGEFTFPAVLKTAEQGYDGKGQIKITRAEGLLGAWCELGGVPCVLEAWIDFRKEMSVIVARGMNGDIQVYPVIDNDHVDHILHKSSVPSVLPREVQEEAVRIARLIADRTQLVGLLAVEMFYTQSGEVWVNELAPRPHNSGHHTQVSTTTSQFAQLVRALAGDKLGTVATRPAVMLNLLGDLFLGANASKDYLKPGFKWASDRAVNVFFYGKKEAHAGRKMGHIIAVGDTLPEAEEQACALYRQYGAERMGDHGDSR